MDIVQVAHDKCDAAPGCGVTAIGGMPWPPAAYLVEAPPVMKLFYAGEIELARSWARDHGGGRLHSLGRMFPDPEIVPPADFVRTNLDSNWHGG